MVEQSGPATLVLAGGGTAGHVNPLIAVAEEYRHSNPQADIHFIGTSEGLENSLVPQAGFPLHTIEKVPFPRRPNAEALRFFPRFRNAIRRSEELLQQIGAEVVLGVGGYVCPPVYLAAQRLGIPFIVHEANSRPGLANKLGALHAQRVATALPGTPLRRAEWVGMPLAAALEQASTTGPAERAAAKEKLGLDPKLPALIVTGGSSGALRLNEGVAAAAHTVLDEGWQILHLTGHGKALQASEFPAVNHPNYQQREYIVGMLPIYQAADLMITRAGAGTVCEVSAMGVPTVFVPLAIGNGEQQHNIDPLLDAGAATMVSDSEFPAWAKTELVALIQDAPRRAAQATALEQFAKRGAATQLVKMIAEVTGWQK